MVLEICLSSFYSNLTSIISGLFAELITGELLKKFIQRSLIRTHKALAKRVMASSVSCALSTFFYYSCCTHFQSDLVRHKTIKKDPDPVSNIHKTNDYLDIR